ncbi:MAG: hypothetical protein M0Z94_10475 [Dehalococcoidales bacterium]|nr:hypothetical protein [Dehalococcoidales bacterium]
MSLKKARDSYQPERHHRRTEQQLVLGGFALVVLVGGALVWFLYGLTPAAIAVAVVLGSGAIFVLLLAVLRALDTWARR